MKKSNFLRKNVLNAPRGITLMSLVVTIIIMLILAGVALRAITTDEGVIDKAKSAKTATEMADLREFVDIAILQAEAVHTNAKMEDVIQQLIDNGIIEDASQVDQETGTITVGKNTLDGALADYVLTPGEKYYGNKNIKATPQTYFTFTVDEKAGTATITGVKDEYAVKTYYNGEATTYTAVIKDGENYITDVVIPYEYVDENGQKYTVTGIGNYAFCLKAYSTWDAGLSNVENTFTSFVLPNTITTIGSSAFRGTTGLESINIPQAVTRIGHYGFYECAGVHAFVDTPLLEYVGEAAFYGCTTLSRINLESLTTLSNSVFWNCTNLNNVIIPDVVTNIGNYTFRGCTSLSDVKIGKYVQSIGLGTFWGCANLGDIDIPDTVTSIENQAFRECTSFSSIQLPEGVTSIGQYAFYGNINLKEINIPDGVNTIGDFGFHGCTSLEAIDIPNSVTDIGAYTFYGCINLNDVKLGNGITSLKTLVFNNCTSLSSIELPSSIISIGDGAFASCKGLKSVNIPESVTSIEKNAFGGCLTLSSINIPDSVVTMGTLVFFSWSATQTINCEILESEKPDTWDDTWDYYNTNTERKAQLNWGVEM